MKVTLRYCGKYIVDIQPYRLECRSVEPGAVDDAEMRELVLQCSSLCPLQQPQPLSEQVEMEV